MGTKFLVKKSSWENQFKFAPEAYDLLVGEGYEIAYGVGGVVNIHDATDAIAATAKPGMASTELLALLAAAGFSGKISEDKPTDPLPNNVTVSSPSMKKTAAVAEKKKVVGETNGDIDMSSKLNVISGDMDTFPLLRNAKNLGEPVRGTEHPYRYVAKGPGGLRIAARSGGVQALSIRAEGFDDAQKKALVEFGLEAKTSPNGAYASRHFTGCSPNLRYRTLAALMSVVWDDVALASIWDKDSVNA